MPKVRIEVPLAATRRPELADGGLSTRETGKTDTSAPLSTRKSLPEALSRRDMAPPEWEMEEIEGEEDVPGAIAARRDRFPEAALS